MTEKKHGLQVECSSRMEEKVGSTPAAPSLQPGWISHSQEHHGTSHQLLQVAPCSLADLPSLITLITNQFFVISINIYYISSNVVIIISTIRGDRLPI